MTDDQAAGRSASAGTTWQAPGSIGAAASASDSPAGYVPAPAMPAPTAYAPPSSPYGAPPTPNAGWAPPPKPGLIPLRPLSFGTILGAPYQALRRNPRPTFGVSLLIQGITIFLTLGVVGAVAAVGLSRLDQAASESDQNQIVAGTVASALIAALIPIAFSLIGSGVMQGVIVLEISRQTLGEKLKFPRLWQMAKGRIWAVAGYSLLATLAIVIALAVLAGIVTGAALINQIGIAVVLGIVFVLAIVVIGAWLSTKLALVPSVMVLERASIRRGIIRSWELTNGRFWFTFGTLLLVTFIINVASQLITTPLSLVQVFATSLFSPTGDPTPALWIAGAVYLITIIATVVVAAVTIVVQSATTVLIYIDARMRKEALDLDLVRFVEARQSGDASVTDPYLRARSARCRRRFSPSGISPCP